MGNRFRLWCTRPATLMFHRPFAKLEDGNPSPHAFCGLCSGQAMAYWTSGRTLVGTRRCLAVPLVLVDSFTHSNRILRMRSCCERTWKTQRCRMSESMPWRWPTGRERCSLLSAPRTSATTASSRTELPLPTLPALPTLGTSTDDRFPFRSNDSMTSSSGNALTSTGYVS